MRAYLLSVVRYFSNDLSCSRQKPKWPLQFQKIPGEIGPIKEVGVQITVIMSRQEEAGVWPQRGAVLDYDN